MSVYSKVYYLYVIIVIIITFGPFFLTAELAMPNKYNYIVIFYNSRLNCGRDDKIPNTNYYSVNLTKWA